MSKLIYEFVFGMKRFEEEIAPQIIVLMKFKED